MSDRTRNRIEGMTDEIKGRGKSAWGELTDDDQKRVEGRADRAKGEFEQRKADTKKEVDEAVDKFTGNR
jgi:uncharacterized protein YjbJ (UPF0337 family)